jgi:hypothetical protein
MGGRSATMDWASVRECHLSESSTVSACFRFTGSAAAPSAT